MIMTPADVVRVVAFVESLWRSRTPPTRIDEQLASYRVSRSEVRAWCGANGVPLDEACEELELAMTKMFFRLRREFPNEYWDAPNARMKETCKRHKLRIPKTRGQT